MNWNRVELLCGATALVSLAVAVLLVAYQSGSNDRDHEQRIHILDGQVQDLHELNRKMSAVVTMQADNMATLAEHSKELAAELSRWVGTRDEWVPLVEDLSTDRPFGRRDPRRWTDVDLLNRKPGTAYRVTFTLVPREELVGGADPLRSILKATHSATESFHEPQGGVVP